MLVPKLLAILVNIKMVPCVEHILNISLDSYICTTVHPCFHDDGYNVFIE